MKWPVELDEYVDRSCCLQGPKWLDFSASLNDEYIFRWTPNPGSIISVERRPIVGVLFRHLTHANKQTARVICTIQGSTKSRSTYLAKLVTLPILLHYADIVQHSPDSRKTRPCDLAVYHGQYRCHANLSAVFGRVRWIDCQKKTAPAGLLCSNQNVFASDLQRLISRETVPHQNLHIPCL